MTVFPAPTPKSFLATLNSNIETVPSQGNDRILANISAFLKEQPTALTEYDEPLVRQLIKKITVFENKFTVEFKSGVTVDVEE